MTPLRTLNGLILLCLALLLGLAVMAPPLPDVGRLSAAVQSRAADNLLQTALGAGKDTLSPVAPRFRTRVGGVEYEVAPLVPYQLEALIVSRHDSKSFSDYIHQAANDQLNILDLCMVWGEFTASGAYRLFHYSNGQFSCTWQGKGEAALQAANVGGIYLDNYHVLSDDPQISKRLLDLKIGDQVQLSGYLADYGLAGGHALRQSSLGRKVVDGRPAGCEVFYVQDVRIIQRGPYHAFWRPLFWGACVLLLLLLLVWYQTPVRVLR